MQAAITGVKPITTKIRSPNIEVLHFLTSKHIGPPIPLLNRDVARIRDPNGYFTVRQKPMKVMRIKERPLSNISSKIERKKWMTPAKALHNRNSLRLSRY